MRAPSVDSNRLDVELLEPGMHPCTLYGMADLGTQDSKFYDPKPQIILCFEFPQQMRVFYKGEQPKPMAIFSYLTFSMHKKAGLRANYVEPMLGRKMDDKEAYAYDLENLLGKSFLGTVAHSDDGKYANIASISKLTQQAAQMFGLTSTNLEVINPMFMYHIPTHGFQSQNYHDLPKFIREKVKQSHEAKEYAAKGGTFNDPVENNQNNNTGATPSGATNYGGKKLIMLPHADFTLEQYKGSGWTDQDLIDKGLAKYQEAVAPQAPSGPGAPQSVPAKPVAPVAPSGPSAPPAQVQKGPKVILHDQSNSIEEWYKIGWTDEMIVEQGKGVWAQQPGVPASPHSNDDVPY